MTTDNPKTFVPDAAFAKRHGFKRQTTAAMRCEGRGPAYFKIGRKVFYTEEDIAAWIATLRHDPAAKRAKAAA